MGRIINPDDTGKRRNQLMRQSAEILRLMSQKSELDDEGRDMLATLVYALREIDEGIEQSAQAWEKRDYWKKAEELRQRWHWPGYMAGQLASVVLEDKWDLLPVMMVKLLPRFAEVKINKMTVKPDAWRGEYRRLLGEKAP